MILVQLWEERPREKPFLENGKYCRWSEDVEGDEKSYLDILARCEESLNLVDDISIESVGDMTHSVAFFNKNNTLAEIRVWMMPDEKFEMLPGATITTPPDGATPVVFPDDVINYW